MSIMDDLRAEVARVKEVKDSVKAFIAGLRQRLADALESENPTDEEIQTLIDELDASNDDLVSAITETPEDPAPTE